MKHRIEEHKPDYSGLPTSKSEDYNSVEYPPDVVEFKLKLYELYYKEHNLEFPGYVLKQLHAASLLTGQDRQTALDKAKQKAEMHYLAAWSRGEIKVKGLDYKPMSNETKEKLKKHKLPLYDDRNKQKDRQYKYNWIKPNSFRKADDSNTTLVDIVCVRCGKTRTTNATEAWHVKLCDVCKKNKKKLVKHED